MPPPRGLTVVAIASGGAFMFAITTGRVPATDFQRRFYRAGHAHAGVLIAAILLPAGFFFSAIGKGRTRPNRWVLLLPAGGLALAAGVVTLGVGLRTA